MNVAEVAADATRGRNGVGSRESDDDDRERGADVPDDGLEARFVDERFLVLDPLLKKLDCRGADYVQGRRTFSEDRLMDVERNFGITIERDQLQVAGPDEVGVEPLTGEE